MREMDLPESLRSDLYLAMGPKDPSPHTSRFAALVAAALEDDAPAPAR